MKMSISVMIHPKRKEFEPYLKSMLGDIPFIYDNKNSVWDTCKRAWQEYDKNADYHVVIQDDAIISKNFKELAEKFIEEHFKPDRIFNFYFGTRLNMRKNIIMDGKRDGFILFPRNMWGVAICVPTKEIPKMIEKCDAMKNIPQDDVRIGKYFYGRKFDVCYPFPSLIDHRIEIESLVGDRGRFRKAVKFIDNE